MFEKQWVGVSSWSQGFMLYSLGKIIKYCLCGYSLEVGFWFPLWVIDTALEVINVKMLTTLKS